MDYQKEYLEKNPNMHLEHASLKRDQLLSVLADFPKGQRILEIGCGAGAGTLELVKKLEPKYIEGIDISEQMISKARELDNKNLVNWRTVGVFDYNVSEPFDLIVCADILEHLTDDTGF
ncbi:MAG: hypothetical protein A3J47_00510 [Candidatus Yanofskybacteria bacterium RIFCSPHIGHO2_02_FULL_43_22]|uniref:Methyltransferase type 12 domain-containing protein n=1 Tax=Candidatus Yanofskybacteria bacterium RIFCSPHIGHO2_02_FULL_43_22 TaxID=1802681 RepID=A0A1F8FQ49_9BACT|nr:MAG: hypothetical protein A3J47_00510 [Candidatus Yanofskybacteria bacterium RIFCSPHIGHO2_02_FULL_43_22]